MKTGTIAVFGATGRTGLPFINKAVHTFRIKALVRNPDKMDFQHEHFEMIEGDILNKADVEKTIKNADAVINLTGHTKESPKDLQKRASQYMLEAMEQFGVKRIISLTGAGVRDPQHDAPKLIDKMVVFVMRNLAGDLAKYALLDGRDHAELIKNSSTDWTIVRGPMLTEDPAKGNIQVGYVGKIKGIKLSREDLAGFILNTLIENQYIHKMPFVTNG
jgi:putative NADH-flavin reductase